MSIIEKLSEGIVNRDMKAEGHALLNKWEATGLLEGLSTQHEKSTMARLLENQAKELLREASSMAAGQDVEGFAAVAFPIVRRVFAGLIANDLVSVQPMSLPSGLIFFLDFTVDRDRLGYTDGESIYGQGAVAKEIQGGVSLSSANAEKGPYALNNGYASATGSLSGKTLNLEQAVFEVGSAEATDKLVRFDPDLASGSYATTLSYTPSAGELADIAMDNLVSIVVTPAEASGSTQVRRLTSFDGTKLTFVFHKSTSFGPIDVTANTSLNYARIDSMEEGGAVGSLIASSNEWQLENNEAIPEIDIKVDSIAITAQTKKLKAKWTPELGQDLNAYHNLDAEVELTSILSEQIAMEIDREILEDLLKGATAGTFYWSRSPGLFVDRATGLEIGASAAAPDFTGTVSEWYETLIETINDVSAQIHRKTLRGGANFIVCGPEVANILEFTAGFRANVTADADKGDIGAVKVGSLSRKFDVMVDPYFPRNAILVGRKGSSFLESGYVYAPYVPLQTTPTIFGTEDFVPRKGVMTRYAKKMVRPDMYGVVVVRGLLGETGA
jgi:hypothetical protein